MDKDRRDARFELLGHDHFSDDQILEGGRGLNFHDYTWIRVGAGSAHLEGSGMPALIGFIFVPFILSSPIDVLTKRMLFMAYELWEDSQPLSDGTTNFRIFTI